MNTEQPSAVGTGPDPGARVTWADTLHLFLNKKHSDPEWEKAMRDALVVLKVHACTTAEQSYLAEQMLVYVQATPERRVEMLPAQI
jgi:hypothetical protein